MTTLQTMGLAVFVVPITMEAAASIAQTASTFMVPAKGVSTADLKQWLGRDAFTAHRVVTTDLVNTIRKKGSEML